MPTPVPAVVGRPAERREKLVFSRTSVFARLFIIFRCRRLWCRARGGRRRETITENNHDAADKRGARENMEMFSVPRSGRRRVLRFTISASAINVPRARLSGRGEKKRRIRRDDTERRGRRESH